VRRPKAVSNHGSGVSILKRTDFSERPAVIAVRLQVSSTADGIDVLTPSVSPSASDDEAAIQRCESGIRAPI
jgi:hypothetical protein